MEITDTLTLSGNTGNALLNTDVNGNVDSITLANGQLAIGSNGQAPVAANITGTNNQISVTNGAGTITLQTPQNIDSKADVKFNSVTSNGFIGPIDPTGDIDPAADNTYNLGTFALRWRELWLGDGLLTPLVILTPNSSGQLIFQSATSIHFTTIAAGDAGADRKLTIPAGALDDVFALLGGTNNWTGTNTFGALTSASINNAGAITSASVTATGNVQAASVTDTGLTASQLVATDGSKNLQSVAINVSNANGANGSLSLSGSTLSASFSNDTSATPTFAGIKLSGLTGPNFVAVDAKGNLTTADVSVENTMVSADTNGALQPTTISNSNGCNTSYAAGVLGCTLAQDIRSSATPAWAGANIGTNGISSTGAISSLSNIASAIPNGTNTSFCSMTAGPQNSGQSALALGFENKVNHPSFYWHDPTTPSLNWVVNAGAAGTGSFPYSSCSPDMKLSSAALTVPALSTAGNIAGASANISGSMSVGTTFSAGASTLASANISGAMTCASINAGTGAATVGAITSSATVTTKNATINTIGTVDTSITSASLARQLGIGWAEILYDDFSSAANFTSDTTVDQSSGATECTINNHSGAINGFLDYKISSSLGTGVYMVEYRTISQSNCGKWQLSFKGNGAGGYTNLRSPIDAYVASNNIRKSWRDFFVTTTGGNTCNLRWTCATKNASSPAYFVLLTEFLRVTQIS